MLITHVLMLVVVHGHSDLYSPIPYSQCLSFTIIDDILKLIKYFTLFTRTLSFRILKYEDVVHYGEFRGYLPVVTMLKRC